MGRRIILMWGWCGSRRVKAYKIRQRTEAHNLVADTVQLVERGTGGRLGTKTRSRAGIKSEVMRVSKCGPWLVLRVMRCYRIECGLKSAKQVARQFAKEIRSSVRPANDLPHSPFTTYQLNVLKASAAQILSKQGPKDTQVPSNFVFLSLFVSFRFGNQQHLKWRLEKDWTNRLRNEKD